MGELIQRLSTYNLFNYLLPGAVFVAVSARVTRHSFVQQDLLLALFVYYFIGLVISRLGSLVIEPLFKWLRVVRFAPYGEYVAASKLDHKIEILSEVNNTYRTLCSTCAAIGMLMLYDSMADRWPQMRAWAHDILPATLVVLFAASYRKQTGYVRERVTAAAPRVLGA